MYILYARCVIAHLNSDAGFPSEILDLYLDFIKFIVEKAGSPTHMLQHTRQFSRDALRPCLLWELAALGFCPGAFLLSTSHAL